MTDGVVIPVLGYGCNARRRRLIGPALIALVLGLTLASYQRSLWTAAVCFDKCFFVCVEYGTLWIGYEEDGSQNSLKAGADRSFHDWPTTLGMGWDKDDDHTKAGLPAGVIACVIGLAVWGHRRRLCGLPRW